MKRLFILLLSFASLGACSSVPPVLTPQEQTTMNTLTSNLKPRCVGRYLIDMPADATVFGWLVEGVTIEAKAMSLNDYHRAMQARSAKLASTRSDFDRFLYTDSVISGVPESRYFISLGNPAALTDTERVIEAYRWDHGYQIKMKITAWSYKDSVDAKNDPTKNDPDMNNVPQKLQLVTSLMHHVHGRSDDEIPTTPGVCFQGGWIEGSQTDNENPSAQFVMPGHDDVDFTLETNTTLHTDDTLLQRGLSMDVVLFSRPLKTLRKGHVALRGMLDAQEVLLHITTDRDIPSYTFMLEANALSNPENRPMVMLTLSTGALNAGTNMNDYSSMPTKSSLDESESIALWDAVSRTLRPRPNAF